MKKLFLTLPGIVVFAAALAGCFNNGNPVTATNYLYVNDTLTAGIIGAP